MQRSAAILLHQNRDTELQIKNLFFPLAEPILPTHVPPSTRTPVMPCLEAKVNVTFGICRVGAMFTIGLQFFPIGIFQNQIGGVGIIPCSGSYMHLPPYTHELIGLIQLTSSIFEGSFKFKMILEERISVALSLTTIVLQGVLKRSLRYALLPMASVTK